MKDTTVTAGATALADIANDGLLGGAPVESEDELREKYGCPRCSLFNGAHKPNCPDRDEATANRDYAREAAADRDYDELMVTWADENARTGRIGGAAENVGCVTKYESEYVAQPTYFTRPRVPDNLRCFALGSTNGHTTLPDGTGKVMHLPDGSCPHCREWRRRLIALRYGLGKGHTQTLIRVVGFASDDYTLPVAVAESMRRRVGGKRLRLLRRGENYLPELVLVYDCEIGDRARGLIAVDLLRKGLQGSTWAGPVTSAMVYALADSEPTLCRYAARIRRARAGHHQTGYGAFHRLAEMGRTRTRLRQRRCVDYHR